MEAVAHDRRYIQVYEAIDRHPPQTDMKSWILVYVSFDNPDKYIAEVFIYIEKQPEKNFGNGAFQTPGYPTPHEAFESLTQSVTNMLPYHHLDHSAL